MRRPVIQVRRNRPLKDGIGGYVKAAGAGVGVGVVSTLLYQNWRSKEGKKKQEANRGVKIMKGAKHIETDRWIDKKTFGISNKILTGVTAVVATVALTKPEVFKSYKYL